MKYYVPITLVVEANDTEKAVQRAVEIVDSVVDLKIEGLDGYSVIANVSVSQTRSEDWWCKDHKLTLVGDSLQITEFELP